MAGIFHLQDSTLCSQDIAVSRSFQSLFLVGEITQTYFNDYVLARAFLLLSQTFADLSFYTWNLS